MSGLAPKVALVAVVFATFELPVDTANTRGAATRGALALSSKTRFEVDAQGNPLTTEDKIEKMELNRGFQNQIQFLLITSPSLGRVTYTRLQNFQSETGRTEVLIDEGVVHPMGIALDRRSGTLYVADPVLKKVFAYTVVVDKKDRSAPTLSATSRTEIMVGKPYKWVSVDEAQNLWWTSTDTPDINKIPYDVISKLRNAEFLPSALSLVSEKQLEAEAAAAAAKAAQNPELNPTDPPETTAVIYTMYEGKINDHVSQPGMILADGPDLFWTNVANGSKSGTVVVGSSDPSLDLSANIGNQTSGVQAFPAKTLVLAQDTAYGLAVTGTQILYTSNTTDANSGVVYCVSRNGGESQLPLKMVSSLETPRGITYDNDFTAYVADEATGRIFSFPTGRLMENAPTREVVTVEGAYALTMFSESDPAFSIEGNSGTQRGARCCLTALLLAAAVSVSAAFALG
mmetsp:Transcript_152413/g.265664  ORF Transcript_152413/g.265664 Transcript_152413/m.265664 type:complete len:458 (+) Transcript_152413:111-1484(+)